MEATPVKEDRTSEAEFTAEDDFKPVDLSSPEPKPAHPVSAFGTQEAKLLEPDQPQFLRPPPVQAPDPINGGFPDRQNVLDRAQHRRIDSYVGFVILPNQVL